MSDALTIARWCWPDCFWGEWPSGTQAIKLTGRNDANGNPISIAEWWPADEDYCTRGATRESIADAERILIERGLESEYGHAIAIELQYDSRGSDRGMFLIEATEDDFAKIATAPLAARVRAMAAVIRALEEKHG